jgi:hypothetical protein
MLYQSQRERVHNPGKFHPADPPIQSWAIARNLALNLYRESGSENMAQAQRLAGFTLDKLKSLFKMT